MGVRDRVRLQGMQVEREVEISKWESLIFALQVVSGSKESVDNIQKVVKNLRDVMSLKVFTEAYRKEHEAAKDSDFELLNKLNDIGD